MSKPLSDADKIILAARELSIYQNLCHDQILGGLIELLKGENPDLTVQRARLFSLLAESVEFSREPVVGDAWQNHVLNLILEDENVFSRKAELTGLEGMGLSLVERVKKDLAALQILFNATGQFPQDISEFSTLVGGSHLNGLTSSRYELKKLLWESRDWALCIEDLAEHYKRTGSGIFGKYLAFRWLPTDEGGYIEGIYEPDPIRLEDLIGYDREREEIIGNTLQFVEGCPANNILLYGDRGTGKSSTIKALIHRFGGDGLRLIEISQEDLGDFPYILRSLRGRANRFILFIDDLSFDEGEREYKSLKAILEGGIEVQPSNVLIYATSNRLHLIRERVSDSKEVVLMRDDDMRRQDTIQEKLSLSDRFGITVTFTAPDKSGYLEIVEGLARQRSLKISKEELRRRALQWELWHNGRSGRTARQFIDQLEGELALIEGISKG